VARGGRRAGTPGTTYTNRTDLNTNRQPVQVATNQPYGVAGQQAAAQRAVPLPEQAPVPSGPFDRPTDRPHEPVTAGIDLGPGQDSSALNPAQIDDDFASQLRAVYQVYPNNDLLRLIEEMDSNP
jgi:hypothetical protein